MLGFVDASRRGGSSLRQCHSSGLESQCPVTIEINAYCARCKGKKIMADAREITMNNHPRDARERKFSADLDFVGAVARWSCQQPLQRLPAPRSSLAARGTPALPATPRPPAGATTRSGAESRMS